MDQSDNLNTLSRQAQQVELYGHREELVRTLQRGELDMALSVCRKAMNEAAERARFNCAPIGPEAHKRNFEAIRALRGAIQEARRDSTV